ncbi:biotin transporter BioY [Nocardioides sp. B-3]|uniref:biotin transporter BioY n=1 Tax=Nocardioides sp. B-3 TaxID=2895565 RepID=UPI002152EA36|nr:biotin transporter BioY [Nocardioides sp. B-3]UUZ59942.1 biotin transporter BioY [Nocardioides sp. B-3]
MSTTSLPSRGTDIALIAGFAALIAVCAISPAISIGGPVPVTLQTFGVLLSGAVLGARRGFPATLLYVVAGAAGLPIFSGGAAGPAVLTGPSAGYPVGFPLAAALCGFIVERLPRRKIQTSLPLIFAAGPASSAVFIHTLGMAGPGAADPHDTGKAPSTSTSSSGSATCSRTSASRSSPPPCTARSPTSSGPSVPSSARTRSRREPHRARPRHRPFPRGGR